MTIRADARTRERGAVGVLMLAVLVIGLLLSFGALRLGAATIGRARAASAADASALAAADALAFGQGPESARTAADEVAAKNDATVVSCFCSGLAATVVVEVDVPGLGGTARARARAEVHPECAFTPERCE